MLRNHFRNFIVVILLFLFAPRNYCQTINHKFLVSDVRQLVNLLETAHPDPYTTVGGKITFHRKVQQLLNSIPQGGMTRVEFYKFLSPFLAELKNGHSSFSPPDEFWFGVTFEHPGGIPIRFDIVEKSLWVSGVYSSEHENLLGSILVSIEGIPFSEIVDRMNNIRGNENPLRALSFLAVKYGYLWYRPLLEWLLPEWSNTSQINAAFRLPSGELLPYTFNLPFYISDNTPVIEIESQYTLPSTAKCDFVYDFIDKDKNIAILKVDGMLSYREFFERRHSWGADIVNDQYATAAYVRYNNAQAPSDPEELLAGLPSATEVFRNLVIEMKEAGTKTLIIDLSENPGGDSFMADIFCYFLYGKQQVAQTAIQYDQPYKISEFYLDIDNVNLDELNENRDFILTVNDYDFQGNQYARYTTDPGVLNEVITYIDQKAAQAPTFNSEYTSEAYCNYYRPENVMVICSPHTFSSGFNFLTHLYDAGATVVGTPSAQAANAAHIMRSFQLNNSQLEGTICLGYTTFFHDDPEKGNILRPHYELIYEKLASYGFDKNAGVIYALELANN